MKAAVAANPIRATCSIQSWLGAGLGVWEKGPAERKRLSDSAEGFMRDRPRLTDRGVAKSDSGGELRLLDAVDPPALGRMAPPETWVTIYSSWIIMIDIIGVGRMAPIAAAMQTSSEMLRRFSTSGRRPPRIMPIAPPNVPSAASGPTVAPAPRLTADARTTHGAPVTSVCRVLTSRKSPSTSSGNQGSCLMTQTMKAPEVV
mmetsp:Transcript_5432/g.21506  ORF Transcript_5432/g.21506 Transcript_5432/m.21506 type:complete len:202 (+) Transcript_5432:283-888(+)